MFLGSFQIPITIPELKLDFIILEQVSHST